jgi:parvulin-like peptidyl-prolyl isomerase
MRNHRHTAVAILLLLAGAAACQKATKDKPAAGSKQGSATAATGSAGSGAGVSATPATPAKDLDSKDILARTETSPVVHVKHVLIGWKDLNPGGGDPRAAKRTNDEAAALAQDIAGKLKAKPDSIDALVKEHSEDPGSLGGEPYQVKSDTPFVPEFKNLALRLKENEVGIVKTNFGYHVMLRVLPPAPDPLESADILARPAETGTVHIQHILVSWKESPAGRAGRGDPRAMTRTKEDADKLAKELLAKVKAKGNMANLMKEFSEDPGSKDTAKAYEVGPTTQMVEPFKNLALRLKLDEAGLAKSPYGWHVMKRVTPPPPPPPDSLESADVLKRAPATDKAKVKHILLGWTGANAGDDRGKTRDRAALEKLVKATVAKLNKGDKIEPLMSELSEDPGSAKSGTTYDVTPDAGLVPPFKDLSLRLKVGEVGVVKTDFGIHIIQRTE